jgi:hypothetical protein
MFGSIRLELFFAGALAFIGEGWVRVRVVLTSRGFMRNFVFTLPSHISLNEQIHYECQRFTNCCPWPGIVAVSEAEIAEIEPPALRMVSCSL